MHSAVYQSITDFTHGAQRLADAMGIRLSRERARAERAASQRGHNLGPWTPIAKFQADEVARCTHCYRTVVIVLGVDPVRSGSALTEGCRS